VVSVWEVAEKELRLKANLYGHSEPITCLASSSSYNIIVSGSKDLTCIVWDLARLSFVRQLVPHSSQIDAVGVNELNGDIATCDSSWLHLWSVNGELIGRIDTAGVGGGGGISHGIICVAFSILNEWDSDNVVMTGSMDGVVRMWSIRYVQVPECETERSGANRRGCDVSGGAILINKSLSEDDSSLVTASDSEPEEVKAVLEQESLNHSLEDVHEALKKEFCEERNNILEESEEGEVGVTDGTPVVVRRHRAFSSGTYKQR
jgi:WD40 repeat protein